mgnify:CR=1 FL=1
MKTLQEKKEKIILLIKEWEKKEAMKIAKELTKEEIQEIISEIQEANSYISVKWHNYQWFNLAILSLTQKPWRFGTFNQWLEEWKVVKKGWTWLWLLMPVMWKDKEWKDEVKFFKKFSVFHEEMVEDCENADEILKAKKDRFEKKWNKKFEKKEIKKTKKNFNKKIEISKEEKEIIDLF